METYENYKNITTIPQETHQNFIKNNNNNAWIKKEFIINQEPDVPIDGNLRDDNLNITTVKKNEFKYFIKITQVDYIPLPSGHTKRIGTLIDEVAVITNGVYKMLLIDREKNDENIILLFLEMLKFDILYYNDKPISHLCYETQSVIINYEEQQIKNLQNKFYNNMVMKWENNTLLYNNMLTKLKQNPSNEFVQKFINNHGVNFMNVLKDNVDNCNKLNDVYDIIENTLESLKNINTNVNSNNIKIIDPLKNIYANENPNNIKTHENDKNIYTDNRINKRKHKTQENRNNNKNTNNDKNSYVIKESKRIKTENNDNNKTENNNNSPTNKEGYIKKYLKYKTKYMYLKSMLIK